MKPTLRAVLGLSLASGGVDVWLATDPSRGWSAVEVLVLFLLGFAGTLPVLAPAASVERRFRDHGVGVALALVLVLHLAVWWRFGPLVNHPLRSPVVLGGWIGGAAGLFGLGWVGGRLFAVAPVGALGALFGGVCLTAALLGNTAAGPDAPAPSGPNVLLITLDTTRPDRMSVYGGPAEMPHLDVLAARGTRFTQAIASAPLTGPSHLSLLTGRFPVHTGVVANGTDIGAQPDALAPVLHAAGYRTAGFVSGYPLHARFGFGQGFDTFDSDFSPVPGLHELAWVGALDALVVRNLPRERRGDLVVNRFDAWLSRADARPFLAWVHLYDPHGPYTPPAEWSERYTDGPSPGEPLALPVYWPDEQRAIGDADYLVAQYDAELSWTDHLVGQVLASLEAAGRLDDTLVVVTADHGESLTEHHILFDHGDDLYDPALRVPLLLAGPGVPAQTLDCQVPTVDLVPTVLGMLGVEDAAERDGLARHQDLVRGSCADREAFATTLGARTADPPIDHALRVPDFKVMRREASGDQAFDLASDPGELHPLGEDPRTAPLFLVLEAVVGGADLQVGELEGQDRAMLEQLGYLDP